MHCVLKVTGSQQAMIVSEHESYGEAIDAWQKLDDERIANRVRVHDVYFAVRDAEDPTGLMAMALFGGEDID